eukprot:gene26219-11951_t
MNQIWLGFSGLSGPVRDVPDLAHMASRNSVPTWTRPQASSTRAVPILKFVYPCPSFKTYRPLSLRQSLSPSRPSQLAPHLQPLSLRHNPSLSRPSQLAPHPQPLCPRQSPTVSRPSQLAMHLQPLSPRQIPTISRPSQLAPPMRASPEPVYQVDTSAPTLLYQEIEEGARPSQLAPPKHANTEPVYQAGTSAPSLSYQEIEEGARPSQLAPPKHANPEPVLQAGTSAPSLSYQEIEEGARPSQLAPPKHANPEPVPQAGTSAPSLSHQELEEGARKLMDLEREAVEDEASELARIVGCAPCILGQESASAACAALDPLEEVLYQQLHAVQPWCEAVQESQAGSTQLKRNKLVSELSGGVVSMVVGSVVADAAATGVHWIYDMEAVGKLLDVRRQEAQEGMAYGLEFMDPPQSPFYEYGVGRSSPYGVSSETAGGNYNPPRQNSDTACAWACCAAYVMEHIMLGALPSQAVAMAIRELRTMDSQVSSPSLPPPKLQDVCGKDMSEELAAFLQTTASLAATPPDEAVPLLGGRNCHMPNAFLTPLQSDGSQEQYIDPNYITVSLVCIVGPIRSEARPLPGGLRAIRHPCIGRRGASHAVALRSETGQQRVSIRRGGEVEVASGSDLRDALQDQAVDSIVITKNVSFSPTFSLLREPIPILRNLSISSPVSAIHSLDFYYYTNVLSLGQHVAVHFRDLVLSRFRRAPLSLGLDVIWSNSSTSSVTFERCQAKRLCCLPESQWDGWAHTFLRPDGSKNDGLSVLPGTCQGGECSPLTVVFNNFSTTIISPYALEETWVWSGFDLVFECKDTLDEACLVTKSWQACTEQCLVNSVERAADLKDNPDLDLAPADYVDDGSLQAPSGGGNISKPVVSPPASFEEGGQPSDHSGSSSDAHIPVIIASVLGGGSTGGGLFLLPGDEVGSSAEDPEARGASSSGRNGDDSRALTEVSSSKIKILQDSNGIRVVSAGSSRFKTPSHASGVESHQQSRHLGVSGSDQSCQFGSGSLTPIDSIRALLGEALLPALPRPSFAETSTSSPVPQHSGTLLPTAGGLESLLQTVRQITDEVQPGEGEKLVLKEQIGKGGFGVVFRGTWRNLEVAVKTMLFSGRDGTRQYKAVNEAALASSVIHANVVCVYHYDIKPVTAAATHGSL